MAAATKSVVTEHQKDVIDGHWRPNHSHAVFSIAVGYR